MKKLKIHYLSIAEKDITNIIDYINKDNPNAALKLIDKIPTIVAGPICFLIILLKS